MEGQPEQVRILDEPISFKELSRTSDGGFRFRDKTWDEFDNGFEVIVVLTREDVELVKEMISKGLV